MMMERQAERNSPNDKPPVFRSMSMADATDEVNEFKKSQMEIKASTNGNSNTQTPEINLYPENFGFDDKKVKRTTHKVDTHNLASSVDTLDTSKTYTKVKIGTELNKYEDHSAFLLLKQALDVSDALILQQKNELKKHANRIEELEQFINSLNLDRSTLARIDLDKSNKKDNESETPKSNKTSPDKPSFSSSSLLASEDMLVATHLAVDERDQPVKKMPNKLAARLALGSNERRKLAVSTDSRNATPSEPSLRGRKLRTEESNKASAAPHNSSSPDLFGTSRDASPGPKSIFEWKTRTANSVCLFIAHDNPQISKTVATQLNKSGSLLTTGSSKISSTNTPNGMQIMLESKGHAKSDLTHFLIGDIIYSGDYAHVQDAVLSNSRGSECLVVTNLRAVRHPVKQFKTRDSNTNKEVIEINLVDVPTTSIVDVSSDSKLADFLSACQARVDCILDPYHSQHTWYPYYEGSSSSSAATHRKMAPQFRSQGIGYIRLGDDMSNFGVAFVSLDAGATYLDNGATSIVDSTGGENAKLYNNKSGFNLMSTFPGNSTSQNGMSSLNVLASSTLQPGSLSTLLTADGPTSALSRKSSRLNIRNVVNSSRSGLDAGEAVSSFCDDDVDIVQVFSKHVQFDAIHEVLQALKESNLKWSQRTELLNSLQRLLADVSLSTSVQMTENKNKSVTMDLLGVLLDQLTKQKNPHVSIATLQCIGTLTYGELLAAHFAVSWRALVVETAHMLRNNNKQIFEAVVGALGSLYRSRALSFAYLGGGGGGVLLDILNGPRSSGGGGSKANNPSSSGNNATLHGGSNIAKVTGWLESAARGDLETCARHVASLETSRLGERGPGSSAVFSSMKSAYLSATAKLLSRVTPLLSHREEASRESVIGLCATYLVLFLLFKSPSLAEFTGVSKLLSSAVDNTERARDALWRLLTDDEVCGALEVIEKTAVRSFEKLMIVTVQSVVRNSQDMIMFVTETAATALLASNSTANSSRATSSSSTMRKSSIPAIIPGDGRATVNDISSGDLMSPTGVVSRVNTTVQKARRPSSNTSTASGATTVDGSLSSGGSPNEDMDAHIFRTFNANTDLRTSPRLSPRLVHTESAPTSEQVVTGPVVSRALPRSSSRSKFNRGAIKQPPASIMSKENTDALGGLWFEAKLLLKRVPESDNAWRDLCEVVRSSSSFFSSLSSAASSLACPVGLVLRSVLPFDEDTSSADQAAGNSSGSGIDAVNKLLRGGGGSPVSRPEMESTLYALRSQATDIRSLIRVKMADEADLKQAFVAVTMLGSFVDKLEAHCMTCCSSMATVIGGLDS